MKAHKTVKIDRAKSLLDDTGTGHNRWHPDIPPLVSVRPGEILCFETRDAYDGQLGPASTDQDLLSMDPGRTHPLTGPVHVEGAEPGDVLEVEILDVVPESYGCGIVVPGVGMLSEHFPEPYIAHFTLSREQATSEQLPGVKLPAAPFMGVMGVAPSREFLDKTIQYEKSLPLDGNSPVRPRSAIPADTEIAENGLVTIPPRSNGGNFDIKLLTRGAILMLPVQVPGALFSAGDAHFIQGDSECVTGLEMGATLYCRFSLQKGLAAKRGISEPQYRRDSYFSDPEQAVPKRFHATTGQSFMYDDSGTCNSIQKAAENSLLNMIRYLESEYGYDSRQAYVICSLAADIRINQAVNTPNYTVSTVLPLSIFD